jgi:thiol-disulfide isomerase/thioredoxin
MTIARPFAALAVSITFVLVASSALIAAPPAPPAPASSPSAVPLVPGDVVTPFEAARLDGTVQHIDFPKGKNTLLLFFLSSCPVCHRMIPLWNEFYSRRPADLEVVGVVLDREPPGFFDAMKIAFPVVRSPGASLHQMFKLKHVPYMVRVGPGGKVETVSEGLTDAIKLGELFRP